MPEGCCNICSDNFIVSGKRLACGYCQHKFHPQCVKVKDSIYKTLQEPGNVFWFCDKCLPIVMDKLAGNLLSSPPPSGTHGLRSAGPEGFDGHVPVIESTVADAVSAKVNEMQAENHVFRNEFTSEIMELKHLVTALKDSNVDLVRLFTQNKKFPVDYFDTQPGSSSRQHSSSIVGNVVSDGGASVLAPSSGSANCVHSRQSNRSYAASVPVSGGSKVGVGGSHITSRVQQPPRGANRSPHLNSKSTVTTGSGGTSNLLKPAPRGRNWIWVGGLLHETTPENVMDHMKSQFPNSDFLVYDLKAKSRRKSFKVGSCDLSVHDLLGSELWPDGVLVKPFRPLPRKK